MAIDGELNETKHLPPFPENYGAPEYWTMDRVIRWLDANDFKSAIDLFKGLF